MEAYSVAHLIAVRHRIRFCGAPIKMRHRIRLFCGALLIGAPQKFVLWRSYAHAPQNVIILWCTCTDAPQNVTILWRSTASAPQNASPPIIGGASARNSVAHGQGCATEFSQKWLTCGVGVGPAHILWRTMLAVRHRIAPFLWRSETDAPQN